MDNSKLIGYTGKTLSLVLSLCMILSMVAMFIDRRDYRNTVLLDFNVEGGKSYETLIDKGSVLNDVPHPVRDGYMFVGWYLDRELTRSFDFSLPIKSDTSFYAGFIKLTSTLSDHESGIGISDCPKDISFYVEADIPLDKLVEGIILKDELTGEDIPFGGIVSGDGAVISANSNFKAGHTYLLLLPEGAMLGDVDKVISSVIFTVASEEASRIEYGGDVIEIPEQNPSASEVLHAYTEKQVTVGSKVLVGGSKKKLYTVTGIESSNNGSCLLLGKTQLSDVSSMELYSSSAVSLTNRTLIPIASSPSGSIEGAEELYKLLEAINLGDFEGSYTAPEIIYEKNGLKISICASVDGPFGGGCDLITAEYTSEITVDGEPRILKVNFCTAVSVRLNVYALKEASGEILSDVSLICNTASRTSAALCSRDGSLIEADEDELRSVIERISSIASPEISAAVLERLSEIEGTLLDGALDVSILAEMPIRIGIRADSLDIESRQVVSERIGIRTFGGKTTSYRSVYGSFGSLSGNICGMANTECGIAFSLSLKLSDSDIPFCDFSARTFHNTDAAGLFRAECRSGSGAINDIEGDAYIRISSSGFAVFEAELEGVAATSVDSLCVGDEIIVPSDNAFECDVYNVYGESLDVGRILCEPLRAVSHSGIRMLYVPSLSDIQVIFSGEYASRITYDREKGIASFDPSSAPDECEIVMEAYIPSDTFKGGELVPIHRRVVLKYSAASEKTVTASFTVGGSVIAKKTIAIGDAPGAADVSNELLAFYSADSFSGLWDKDPYAPIYEDTEYAMVTEKIGVSIAHITYRDGKWHAEFERATLGDAPSLGGARAPSWTYISRALGIKEAGIKSPVRLSEDYARFGRIDSALTEAKEFDSFAEAFEYAEVNAAGVYVADYSGETFDVKYTVGDEVFEIKYEKNLLRKGFPALTDSYSPKTEYAILFGGWRTDARSDLGASLSALLSPARFKVSFEDDDGTVLSEEEVVIGEIPVGLSKAPERNGKKGVWLSAEHGNFVGWTDYPSMTAIYRDTVIKAYYGELCRVTVEADGGSPISGELPKNIVLVPGEFDFSVILPEMKKATDAANSYIFNGWGVVNVSSDMQLKAPFTAKPHVYRIELDAAGGSANGEGVFVAECTYHELEALRKKLIDETVPEKQPTKTEVFTFVSWNSVKTDRPYTVRYKAEYLSTERLYTVLITAPDGGLFPNGEAEITLYLPYNTVIEGLDSNKYLARIPSEEETVKVVSAWLLGEERLSLDASITVTEDIVIKAEYTERENPVFKVVLDAKEGFFSNGNKILVFEGRIGDPVPMPSVPSLDTEVGYTSVFLGWDGIIPEVFTEDVSLSASYKKEKAVYTVTYYGINSVIHAVYRVQYGDVIPIPKPPVLEGNTFIGWSGIPESGTMGGSHLKIYARFDRNEHTISYYVDGKLVETEKVFYGDKLLRKVYPYKPGYVFSGWDYPNLYYMPDRDLTVSGTFTKGKYAATYYHNGKVLGVISYTYGEVAKLPPLPKGASVWKSTDVEISDGTFVMTYKPITFYTDSTGGTFTVDYTVDGKIISTGKYKFADKIKAPSVPDDPRFTGRWIYRLKNGGGDFEVTDYMPDKNLVAVPELKITNLLSGKDINKNGKDDYLDLIETARDYVNSRPIYESIFYDNTGYPTDWHGVCTDVIWRAYFGIGISFKDLVDSDIAFCQSLGEDNPYKDIQATHLIDFRRVVNLKEYYERNSTVLTTDTSDPTEWQPGDIVIFSPSHIGICSDRRDSEGLPYIIHHTYSRGAIESDELGRFNAGDYEIVGHYRINVETLK